ncbi:MAG: hypothetical protein WB817_15645, partial [Terriglobales bacterium]
AQSAIPRNDASVNARATETVRVSVGVLDRLMGIVSELVLTRNQLLELSVAVDDERVKGSVQNLSSVTSDGCPRVSCFSRPGIPLLLQARVFARLIPTSATRNLGPMHGLST